MFAVDLEYGYGVACQAVAPNRIICIHHGGYMAYHSHGGRIRSSGVAERMPEIQFTNTKGGAHIPIIRIRRCSSIIRALEIISERIISNLSFAHIPRI